MRSRLAVKGIKMFDVVWKTPAHEGKTRTYSYQTLHVLRGACSELGLFARNTFLTFCTTRYMYIHIWKRQSRQILFAPPYVGFSQITSHKVFDCKISIQTNMPHAFLWYICIIALSIVITFIVKLDTLTVKMLLSGYTRYMFVEKS